MKQWNIKSLLNWTSDYFAQKGIPTPRLDAELLLSHYLGLKKIDLYLQFDRPMNVAELSEFKAIIKRRINHEPVAYITHKKEFWSREFHVSSDVLIPRPETELLIESILDWVIENNFQDKEISGYEIGLGSGNIAITLLSELPNLKMTAIEISSKAIAIAKKNAEYHGVGERLNIVEGDVVRAYGPKDLVALGEENQYDIIVSNPPYVAESEKDKLPPSVREHEPGEALFAKEEGLVFYPCIKNFAENSLREEGIIAVEIGETQGNKVSEIFTKAGYKDVVVKKDYAGLERIVVAIR